MGEPAAVKSSGSTTPAGIDSPRPPSPSAQLVGTESSFVALAAVEEAVSPKQKSPVDKAAVTAQAQAAVAAAVAAAAAIEIAIEPSTESSTGPASQNGTSGTSTPAAPGPETRRVGNGPAEGSPATHPTTHQRSQNQHWHEHHERHQERPLQQPNSATKHFVRLNGRNTFPGDEVEVESEPSDAESNPPLRSPSGVGLEDEIVVDAQDAKLPEPTPPVAAAATPEDVTMDDAHDPSAVSHYPKRKRNSLYQDLSETRMESSQPSPQPRDGKKAKGSKEGTVKVATLGWWRDSNVPELHQKHVVVGFIDIRDRLRTRIQPQTMAGEPLTGYPLPPGPGGSWVTFERIIFSDHLVGLDHAQVKEYTRLRCEVRHAEADEERAVTEAEAVREAMRRVRENPAYDNPAVPPPIARGVDLASRHAQPTRADSKRRKTNNGFSILGSTPRTTPAPEPGLAKPSPQPMSAHQNRFSIDPLPGTRPTRILIGHWSGSSEPDLRDRHAVYGILGQNDMFRVKVVRETRDGRFVDGNFPTGAGALWIPYEEVGFDAHLVGLSRQEVKEYCRVRQYQLDHKEQEADREANERKAVAEAKARAGATFKLPAAPDVDAGSPNPRADQGGHEVRQSRRIEPRPELRTLRPSLGELEIRPRNQAPEALERTSAIARREIARVEAAQSRADLHALSRERAAAAAAGATTAAAAAAAAAASSPTVLSNGRALFHESDEMRRLNKVWARQESIRVKAGAEDAKMYDGVKYERKATGPFMGKLVSQGTIINIDGDDYVEYRVLTKPSFF